MTKPFDPTKPVQTRDARSVRILCTNLQAVQPVAAAVRESDGHEHVEYFFLSGAYYASSALSPTDLVNIPVELTQEVWLNVYPDNHAPCAYFSRESADDSACGNRIACVLVVLKFKEGQGL